MSFLLIQIIHLWKGAYVFAYARSWYAHSFHNLFCSVWYIFNFGLWLIFGTDSESSEYAIHLLLYSARFHSSFSRKAIDWN